MLFNSIEFVIFFVAVLTVVAIVKHREFKHLFLLGASYLFFAFSSDVLVSLLISSTLLDFYVGKEIAQSTNTRRKKILLAASLAGNLGLLGFFKYADFGIQQINSLASNFGIAEIPLLYLALPIGISFYTFQTISYTVDVYRGKLEPCKSLKEFALFVAFFPQLVAGPIVRASHFLPQLREKFTQAESGTRLRQIIIHNSSLKFGITLMTFGFVKKMFFADNIAPLANQIFDAPVGMDSFTIILGAIAFGVQIYGDFSGYSDIAIGAAAILGFNIPRNFNRPYFAISPSDFWRRWHISLSSWLRDYLYIPLGGNRKSNQRTYLNLFTVMFLGGLWHGASWNFVVWGLLHGAYLAIHKAILSKFGFAKKYAFFKSKLWLIASILITQYFVFMAWIPFRVHNTDHMLYAIQKYVVWDFATQGFLQIVSENKLSLVLIVGFLALNYISYKRNDLVQKISSFKLRHWALFLFGAMILILFLYDGAPQDFIYFRF